MFKWEKTDFAKSSVIAPNQRLGWGKTISLGLQHIVAMFGATFIVPILTGFSPATTLFFSGIGTALFLLITKNKLPSYLGSSFAFIAPITAAKSGGGVGDALFGIVIVGALLAIIGIVVQKAGVKWIDLVMPPVVTGAIVALIGFNLAPTAWQKFSEFPITGFVTLISIIIIGRVFKNNMLGRLSILLGVIIGYILAVFRGEVDFTTINQASWFGLPQFTTPTINFSVIIMFLPVLVALIAENVGHVKSVSTMTGQNLDHLMGKALFAGGISTILAGFGGGSGTTTYAENIGVMAATKVYSTAAYWVAAAGALILSLCPKFGALIATIPNGVLGGATTLLYGMIGLLGVQIWLENKVDFKD
ncbi:MAG: NCS2 family nucleobase:cation symporter, partial [Candidatus Ancillula sp.]|nr:NCS2 family nucleobase:cation symporter [Candidatus Ancillula sp.]